MRCRFCGRDSDGRHSVCWRCLRGLPRTLFEHRRNDAGPLVCVCATPRPQRVGGIWDAVDAWDCARCRKAVLDERR